MSAYIVDHATIHAILTWARGLHISAPNLHKLPGYDAAPWGVKDHEVGSVISLSSLASKPSKRRAS